MKFLAAILGLVLFANCCVAEEKPALPELKVAADGFPGGHETPEGAACDLARAFINRDETLFQKICLRPYATDKGPPEYAEFLKSTAEGIKAEAGRKEEPARGPKAIGKVFAARHLTKKGPASYGHSAFDFKDVMFVDVGVMLHGDKRALNRTLVVKDSDGKWYVHPLPAVSPLLSDGLNDEEASKQDFSQVYRVQKEGS